jgi:hypothetical protein
VLQWALGGEKSKTNPTANSADEHGAKLHPLSRRVLAALILVGRQADVADTRVGTVRFDRMRTRCNEKQRFAAPGGKMQNEAKVKLGNF